MTRALEGPDRPGRRILVTNHHLEVLAGSELASLEIADGLRARGHHVALFTLQVGNLATGFSARSCMDILDPGRMAEVREFDPEMIHAHHWPTLAYLRRFGIDAPAVMGFLGVLPDLENPPPLPTGAAIPWWAVSEEVAANVHAVGGWSQSRSMIIRNWYDDRSGLPTPKAHPTELRRLLVVSNHFPPALLASLSRAADLRGASVEHIGLPDNPRAIDDALLRSFDAVITLGRTAITCLANAIPVLILDEGGGDGWVTTDSVAQLARSNFSGRAHRLEPSQAQLDSWLDTPPTQEDLSNLRAWVDKEARLSTAVDHLEDLYRTAADQLATNDLGRWSRTVGDYVLDRHARTGEVRRLLGELAAAEAQREQLAVELTQMRQEGVRAQMDLAASQAELDACRSQLAELSDLRHGLLESASWRITAPLRASKRLSQEGHTQALVSVRQHRESARQRAYSSPILRLHAAAASSYFREVELSQRPFQRGLTGEPSVRRSTGIPPQAWLGELDANGWAFTLGDGVERSREGFFEGVWTGAYDQFRPDQSEFAFGSGAVWRQGAVVFVPPRQPEEALFMLHDAERRRSFVGNSLAFVLEAGKAGPSSSFFSRLTEVLHDATFDDGKRGVDRTEPLVLSCAGFTLYRIVFHNFEVGREGTLRRRWTRPRRDFTTFASYRDFLEARMRELVVNGAAPARRRPLKPMTSLSGGYDSTAVSALAARAGCLEAVTLAVSVYGRDDSGTSVGSRLGLNVTEHPHPLGTSIDQLDFDGLPKEVAASSLEFIATAGIGDDVAFLPFEDRLADTICFSGAFGDSIWAREADVDSGLPVRVMFGKSITEFRLRTSFAYVPVPFIGARFAPPIRAISKSPEMAPFTMGTDYDRPIPRRIAEESGVPRGAFGTAKTATAPWFKDHQAYFPEAISVISRRYEGWADT